MAMAEPVYSLKHFLAMMERLERSEERLYPFYSVLLYAPMNGLDGRLHQYMTTHWDFMSGMTGWNWLLLAVEDFTEATPSINDFKPEQIYDIARSLGQSPDAIPCLVFFVDPANRNDTLTMKLDDFLSAGSPPDDEELTDFFRSLASMVDACRDEPVEGRLQCLRQRVNRNWPEESVWAQRTKEASDWLITSTTTASTVVAGLTPVLMALRNLFGS